MTLKKYLENSKIIGERSEFVLNKKIDIPVYMVDIYDLRFNPYNTRIKTHQLTYGLDKTSLEDKEAQKMIQNLINKDRSSDSKVPSSIRKAGVLREIIALSNGLILSGNNRVAILREMIESGEDIPREIKVAILDKELTKNEIISIEQSLQKEYDAKDEYKKMNIVLQVRDSINVDGSNLEQISQNLGLDQSKIRKYEQIADYYEDFLFHCNMENKFNYHDKYDVYSKLNEVLKNDNNNKLTSQLKRSFKWLIYDLMVSTNASIVELNNAIIRAVKIKQEYGNSDYLKSLKSLMIDDEEALEKAEFVKAEIKKSLDEDTKISKEARKIKSQLGEMINSKINSMNNEMKTYIDDRKSTLSPDKVKKELDKIGKKLEKFIDLYDENPDELFEFPYWMKEIKKIIE